MTSFYSNKLVYITGGSSGIGLALAEQLAAQGASILLIARNVEKLMAAVSLVETHRLNDSQKINFLSVDVTSTVVAEKLDAAVEKFGIPKVLITSAGVAVAKPFFEHTIEDFRYNLDANVMGTVVVVHQLALHMRKAGGGNIALIGSLGGLMPVWGYSAYSTSKAALIGFAGVLQYELASIGFKVSLVAPPEVDTPMITAEAATVPKQTRFIKDIVGTTSPEKIASHTLKYVATGKPLIIYGFRANLFYLTQKLVPSIYRFIAAQLFKLA